VTGKAFGLRERWQMTSTVTVGLDVADQYSSYCALDPVGEVLEEGRIKTSEAAFRKHFASEPGRIVLEAGTHSPWIERLFTELGWEAIVANPRKVQLIAQGTRKNDRSDAETLARLGRIDPRLEWVFEELASTAHRLLADGSSHSPIYLPTHGLY
jgi:transposase